MGSNIADERRGSKCASLDPSLGPALVRPPGMGSGWGSYVHSDSYQPGGEELPLR